MSVSVQLEVGKLKALIIDGSLRSFQKKKQEWIHHPDAAGWNKSDDEMFPVIGATSSVDYQLYMDDKKAFLDQHGLIRALKWSLIGSNEHSALFEVRYTQNTSVSNPKFPLKSPQKTLQWPYSFVMRKHFSLSDNKLTIRFEVEAPEGMPYQMGYHPAFKLESTEVVLQCSDQKHPFEEIFKAGHGAYPLLNCSEVILSDGRRRKLHISTEGFGHIMCWTEVKNMICIEPITHYPAQFDLSRFEKDSFKVPENGKRTFSVHLKIE